MKNLFAPLFLLVFFSCSNEKNGYVNNFVAGFKTIQTKDTSRVYKPNTDTSDYLHYRPIDIDIWYPATDSSKDTALHFRNILGLLETRANYYTASNVGNGFAQQIAHYFSESLKCSDSSKVLNFKTKTYKNAPPAKGKYPLVVYLSAFNGMSYENFTLFEQLAQKGFVVASVSSIGRFPGDMTIKYEDLMEQVNDAVSTLNVLKVDGNIDFDRIGIIGYSWGGLAGSILANRIPNAGCLVSLDGSEFHHFGSGMEEDYDFSTIVNSSEFSKMKISSPYLRLESASLGSKSPKDSVYDFSQKLMEKPQILVIDSAAHEDFGCLVDLVKKSGNCMPQSKNELITRLTIDFLEDKLKNRNTFTKLAEQEIGKRTIHKK
jgi:pimeloyl-ACP methyl ester carboxylesterase